MVEVLYRPRFHFSADELLSRLPTELDTMLYFLADQNEESIFSLLDLWQRSSLYQVNKTYQRFVDKLFELASRGEMAQSYFLIHKIQNLVMMDASAV